MKKKKRKETTLWRTIEQALFSPCCKINSLFKTDFLRSSPPESTWRCFQHLLKASTSSPQLRLGPVKCPPQQEQSAEHLRLFNAKNWFYPFVWGVHREDILSGVFCNYSDRGQYSSQVFTFASGQCLPSPHWPT